MDWFGLMYLVPSHRRVSSFRQRNLEYCHFHLLIPVRSNSLDYVPIANEKCSDIPIVITVYSGWKLLERTKILPLDEIPIRDALDEILRNPEEQIPPTKGWQRLNILWG